MPRTPAREDAESLIRPRPAAPGLCVRPALFLDRRPGERVVGDLLYGPARRVDPAHRAEDDGTAMIYAMAADDTVELARNRIRRGRLDARGPAIRSRAWKVSMTGEAATADGWPGLRMADLIEDDHAVTLQQLHGAGSWSRWATRLEARRQRDRLVGFYVRDERDDAPTVLLAVQALRELHDLGLVAIEPYEAVHSPRELFPGKRGWERLDDLKRSMARSANESGVSGKLLAQMIAIGAAIAWLLGIIDTP